MMLISVKNIYKKYGTGSGAVNAVDGVSFEVKEGEIVAIVGRSGSGKSTLLNLIGGLDCPDSGSIVVDGIDLRTLNAKKLAEYRRKKVGFVYQNYNLLPSVSVYDNVVLPAVFDGHDPDRQEVLSVLDVLGIREKAACYPSQLSGGQQQRASIARALVNSPKLILADEPTGNLDSKSGKETIEFLCDICRRYGRTLIMVTHDSLVASYSGRLITLQDGKIRGDDIR